MLRPLALVVVLLAACSTPPEVAPTTTAPAPATTTTVAATTTTVPPTTTSTVPPTTTTTVPPKGTLVIHGVGDVSLDPAYIPALAVEGYDHAWSGLEGIFVDDDLTVINLECPMATGGTIVPKAFNFRCDPDALDAMVDAGIDVAGQANNHILDYGVEAMLESRDRLVAAGVAAPGVGADASEAYRPAVLEVDGWRIAVLGFSGPRGSNSWVATEERAGMADARDPEAVVAAVEAAAADADLVVVTIHWGVELDTTPRPDQITLAREMVAAGADVIFGHHAHRLQPMSMLDGAAVFWGLGNFVWPRLSVPGSTTAVAEVVISPEGEVIDACLIPTTIVSSGHPVLNEDYRGCTGVESATIELPDIP